MNDTSERNFKGVWIPKELWLDTSASPMEKFFLIEIDSLDGDDGCYASNKHFSELFDLSKGRCTQIIKKLESKGWINVELIRDGKIVSKRIIRVVNKLNTPLSKTKHPLSKTKHPLSKTKHPYIENDEENNTNNNISITTIGDHEKSKVFKKPNIKKIICDNWQPSDRCFELMTRAGISREFANGLVDEFVLYWQGRSEKRSGWDSTFLNHVKLQFKNNKPGLLGNVIKGGENAAHSEFDEKYGHLQIG